MSNEHGSQVKDQGRRQCCHNKHKKFPYQPIRDVSLLSGHSSYIHFRACAMRILSMSIFVCSVRCLCRMLYKKMRLYENIYVYISFKEVRLNPGLRNECFFHLVAPVLTAEVAGSTQSVLQLPVLTTQ